MDLKDLWVSEYTGPEVGQLHDAITHLRSKVQPPMYKTHKQIMFRFGSVVMIIVMIIIVVLVVLCIRVKKIRMLPKIDALLPGPFPSRLGSTVAPKPWYQKLLCKRRSLKDTYMAPDTTPDQEMATMGQGSGPDDS